VGLLGRLTLQREFARQLPLHDDFAADGNRFAFAAGVVVAGAADAGMHARAAQLIDADILAGRCLDQRRAAEKYRTGALDDNGIVGKRRNIGAAGSAVAEYQRQLLATELGEL